jgi:Xaa-Pro dipeptidase
MRVMPAGVYLELEEYLPQAKLMPAGDVLLECRRIKSNEEQEFMLMAGRCADAGIEALMKSARPGVSERELVNAIEFAMIEEGAQRGNFILLTSAPWEERNNSIGIPARPERKLQKGDLILNELCPNYSGYYVQQCIPISVDIREIDMPDSFRELFALHKEMYQTARTELRPGTTVADIERKIAKLTSSRGDFARTWALQVGELAESHFRLNYAEIKPGMTWVNHPWTEPPRGKLGHRGHFLGNTLIVTEDGPEVTSKIPCLELYIV